MSNFLVLFMLHCCAVLLSNRISIFGSAESTEPSSNILVHDPSDVVIVKRLQNYKSRRNLRRNTTSSNVNDLIEGDIMLPGHQKAAKSLVYNLWNSVKINDRYVIYVYIDDVYTSTQLQMLKSAIKKVQMKVRVIRFKFIDKPFTNGVPFLHYGKFAKESICASYVGKINYMASSQNGQKIWLQDACFQASYYIQHETMHALGVYHEQARQDRNQYVDVYYDNIKDGYDLEFRYEYGWLGFGKPYDYDSIMHYGEYLYSKNNQKTINGRGHSIGDVHDLDDNDATLLRLMYQCNDGPRTYEDYLQNPCTFNCKCGLQMKGCKGNDSLCAKGLKCIKNRCLKQKWTTKNQRHIPVI